MEVRDVVWAKRFRWFTRFDGFLCLSGKVGSICSLLLLDLLGDLPCVLGGLWLTTEECCLLNLFAILAGQVICLSLKEMAWFLDALGLPLRFLITLNNILNFPFGFCQMLPSIFPYCVL